MEKQHKIYFWGGGGFEIRLNNQNSKFLGVGLISIQLYFANSTSHTNLFKEKKAKNHEKLLKNRNPFDIYLGCQIGTINKLCRLQQKEHYLSLV